MNDEIEIYYTSTEHVLTKKFDNDSGYDIRALANGFYSSKTEPGTYTRSGSFPHILKPQEIRIIETGICLEIGQGSLIEGQIRPKSSLTRMGLLAHFGTIDEGYRGEIKVIVQNIGNKYLYIYHGDHIAQLVFNRLPNIKLYKAVTIDNRTARRTRGLGWIRNFDSAETSRDEPLDFDDHIDDRIARNDPTLHILPGDRFDIDQARKADRDNFKIYQKEKSRIQEIIKGNPDEVNYNLQPDTYLEITADYPNKVYYKLPWNQI